MVEASYLCVLIGGTVPDVNFTHDAACSNQVVCIVAEFALHEVLIKVLSAENLNVSIVVDLPDASNHI